METKRTSMYNRYRCEAINMKLKMIYLQLNHYRCVSRKMYKFPVKKEGLGKLAETTAMTINAVVRLA